MTRQRPNSRPIDSKPRARSPKALILNPNLHTGSMPCFFGVEGCLSSSGRGRGGLKGFGFWRFLWVWVRLPGIRVFLFGFGGMATTSSSLSHLNPLQSRLQNTMELLSKHKIPEVSKHKIPEERSQPQETLNPNPPASQKGRGSRNLGALRRRV